MMCVVTRLLLLLLIGKKKLFCCARTLGKWLVFWDRACPSLNGACDVRAILVVAGRDANNEKLLKKPALIWPAHVANRHAQRALFTQLLLRPPRLRAFYSPFTKGRLF